MIQRWVFTEAEGNCPHNCNVNDEFISFPPGYDVGIMVCRNGEVTNRWADGTIGVTPVQREAADVEFVLYDEENDCTAEKWLDVEVDEEGNFIAFVTEKLQVRGICRQVEEKP